MKQLDLNLDDEPYEIKMEESIGKKKYKKFQNKLIIQVF